MEAVVLRRDDDEAEPRHEADVLGARDCRRETRRSEAGCPREAGALVGGARGTVRNRRRLLAEGRGGRRGRGRANHFFESRTTSSDDAAAPANAAAAASDPRGPPARRGGGGVARRPWVPARVPPTPRAPPLAPPRASRRRRVRVPGESVFFFRKRIRRRRDDGGGGDDGSSAPSASSRGSRCLAGGTRARGVIAPRRRRRGRGRPPRPAPRRRGGAQEEDEAAELNAPREAIIVLCARWKSIVTGCTQSCAPLPMPRNIPKHIAGKSPASARATSAEPRTTRTRHAHAATRAERVARETDEEAPPWTLHAPHVNTAPSSRSVSPPSLIRSRRSAASRTLRGGRAGGRADVRGRGGSGVPGDRRAVARGARPDGAPGTPRTRERRGGEYEGRAPVPDTKHVTRNASAYSSNRRSMAREDRGRSRPRAAATPTPPTTRYRSAASVRPRAG